MGKSIRLLSDILEYTAECEKVGILFLLILRKHSTQSHIHLYLPLLNHLEFV